MHLLLATVLFIFGPSCGGKSTLSKALVEKLGPSWTYVDRDQLIEDGLCSEEEANLRLEEKIARFQSQNRHLIIDKQVPWRTPRNGSEKYVLVYAPLPELLAKDARRTDRLERSSKRAYYARLYVEETFLEVFKAPNNLHFKYDAIFDSSQMSIDAEAKQTLELLDHMHNAPAA